jgi:hypothetical protein
MDQHRRFSGGQITVIIVAIAAVAVGTPATVLAATGTSVRIVDRSNAHHAVSVSKAGAMKVALAGTATVKSPLPAKSIDATSETASQIFSTDPCGSKYAISSFSVTNTGGGTEGSLEVSATGSNGSTSLVEYHLATYLEPSTGQTEELTFPQPLVVSSPKLPKGYSCEKVQLRDGGGGADNVDTVVGFRIH